MNFKQIGFGLATAVTVTVATIGIEAPAQALSLADNPLTGVLSIDLDGLIESVDPNFVDFGTDNDLSSPGTTFLAGSNFDASTGSFTGITSGTIQDLPIQDGFPSSGIDNFITLTDGSNSVTFDLLKLINEDYRTGAYTANLRGIFNPTGQPNDSGIDIGQFRLTTTFNTGSLEITPVPTPALLPGLIGMGITALRKKRKGEIA